MIRRGQVLEMSRKIIQGIANAGFPCMEDKTHVNCASDSTNRVTRRDLLEFVVSAGALQLMTTRPAAAQQNTSAMPNVKTLVFDVFGTFVDWRGSIAEEGAG
jgi:hypothetical protein